MMWCDVISVFYVVMYCLIFVVFGDILVWGLGGMFLDLGGILCGV